MSRHADFWQKLLQIRNGILQGMQAILGTWPGLITITLLFVTLTVGISLLSRSSTDASAQSPGPSRLTQISTRVPTRGPVTPRPTYTSTATVVPTATATPTATRRQPTPTWTPFPTATAIAASPLSPATTPAETPSATEPMTRVVPLPSELTGPQVAPVEVITTTHITATQEMTDSAGLTATTVITATDALSETNIVTETVDILSLLVPTPTPTSTPTINEALEQPIAPSGLAGIAATATAIAPSTESEMGEAITEEPVAESEGGEGIAENLPLPAPTVASQPTPDGNVRTASVPILMYHYVSVPPANADIYRKDLSVSPELLAQHLDALQQAGYTPISLYAFFDNLMTGAPLPEKPVVLTFDDGYIDNYTNAYPLLRERGMTATFFIVTDFINDGRPEYLTWDMVREMYAGGMSIEGHGRNHVSLANKDRDYLIWQALGTYESIELEIGVRPRFISYPAGEYDQLTIDIFSSAGYWAGFTTKQGATHASDDLFRLLRIRIRGTTTAEELLRILTLDW